MAEAAPDLGMTDATGAFIELASIRIWLRANESTL
jgi:hypothetical protein